MDYAPKVFGFPLEIYTWHKAIINHRSPTLDSIYAYIFDKNVICVIYKLQLHRSGK